MSNVEVLDTTKFTDEEKTYAASLEKDIALTLVEIKHSHDKVTHGFARLGIQLHEVRGRKLWLLWEHPTFGSYINKIMPAVEKGRTQLYHTISVAENLLPYVDESDIESMGITKAGILSRAAKKSLKGPSPEILEKALDPDVDIQELKATVFEAENVKSPETEQTKYFDFGGAYLTAEEKSEIERTFDIAARVDPPISNELPEHIRKREIMLRLSREFLSAYESQVTKGEA